MNAPFRLYYAFNLARLYEQRQGESLITRSMFPAGAAGDYTFQEAVATYSPKFLLREPLRTFRFTVGTSF